MAKTHTTVAIFLLFLSAEVFAEGIVATKPPGRYGGEIRVGFYTDIEGAECFFRYDLADSVFLPCDRSFGLFAAPGEERNYSLIIEARRGDQVLATGKYGYIIDKRAPEPPQALPSGGEFSGTVSVSLSASADSRIHYALLSPGVEDPRYREYLAPIILNSDPDSVIRSTVLAWTEDDAGNASAPASFRYTVYPSGTILPKTGAGRIPAGNPPAPQLPAVGEPEGTENGFSVVFSLREGTRLLAAVSAESAHPPRQAWFEPESDSGVSVVEVPISFGYTGKLYLHYAATDGNGFLNIATNPIPLKLAAPVPAKPEKPKSPEPRIDMTDEGFFSVNFPGYTGTLRFRFGSGPYAIYEGPLVYRPKEDSGNVEFSWFLERQKVEADPRSVLLPVKRLPKSPDLSGIPENSLTNKAVSLRPKASIPIRYEFTKDGSLPKDPGTDSPLLEDTVSFDVKEGEAASFLIRYRAYNSKEKDALAGDDRFARFTIDRKKPDPPALVKAVPSGFVRDGVRIAFAESPDSIRFSVSRDGKAGQVQRYSEPLVFEPPAKGSVSISVRAWTEDEAGNTSAEIPPILLVLDKDDVYVSDKAPSGGGKGSPDSPYSNLNKGIEDALTNGRTTIRLSGSFSLEKPLLVNHDIAVSGGWKSDFSKASGERSVLKYASVLGDSPAISIVSAGLAADGILFQITVPPSVPAISCESAVLVLSNSKVNVASPGDCIAVKSIGSELSLSAVDLSVSGRNRSWAFILESSIFALDGTSVTTDGKANFAFGISATDSSLALSDSLFILRASQGLLGIDADGGAFGMERSRFDLGNVEGSAEFGKFEGAAVGIFESVFLAGNASLVSFLNQKGGSFSLSSSSVILARGRASTRCLFFDGADPAIERSNFYAFRDLSAPDLSGNPAGDFFVSGSKARPEFGAEVEIWGFARLSPEKELADLIFRSTKAADPKEAFPLAGKGDSGKR